MLNRLIRAVTETESPTVTPLEIANGVRRLASHQLEERRLDSLRNRSAAIREAMARVWETARNTDERTNALRPLAEEDRAIDIEIRAVRETLVPLRAAHGERVAAALAPMRAEAGKRLAAAIDELEAALNAVNAINAAKSQHGFNAVRFSMPDLRSARRASKAT